jgi:pyridine nucleotide-disulfide oxidoreductase family protein
MRRVVLLGGGHAHVHVLQDLARQPMPGADVTLVSPFGVTLYSGMVPGLVAGRYAAADCSIALKALAERAKVHFVDGSAFALDAAKRRVSVARPDGNTQAVDYDVMSIDTGAVIDRAAIPGAREHALFVRPIDHFVRLLDRLLDMVQTQPRSVVVVGAGAAGVELALALARRIGSAGHVSLVTGGPAPLANYPPTVRTRAARALRRAGITVLEEPCREITATHVLLGGGARLACDAPVLAVGTSAPPWLAPSGLTLDDAGFIATGRTLQSNSHPEVFAAGDVAARPDAPHPRSGVYAVRAGPPLALNLRRFVAGGQLAAYRPQAHSLNLIACGDGRAIGAWGNWSFEGRWVGWWKDRIDRRFIARFR